MVLQFKLDGYITSVYVLAVIAIPTPHPPKHPSPRPESMPLELLP